MKIVFKCLNWKTDLQTADQIEITTETERSDNTERGKKTCVILFDFSYWMVIVNL